MTNDRFYQHLSKKLADLPDDPAFNSEDVWARIPAPASRRRALGAWLWPTSLAASVLLLGGVWFFIGKPVVETTEPVAVVKPPMPRPAGPVRWPETAKPSAPRSVDAPTDLASRKGVGTSAEWSLRLRATPPLERPLAKVETGPRSVGPRSVGPRSVGPRSALPKVVILPPPVSLPTTPPDAPSPVVPAEVAQVESAPQPELAETPGTVVLTIPVPGEETELTRKPFVARLFKQWKRYNRGETVDWEDLGLKPLNLAKARADSTRLMPRSAN